MQMKTVGIIALAVCLSVSLWSWQIAEQKPGASAAPTASPSPGSDSRLGVDGPVRAEDVFKSIEIFKGKPATQVLIAMNAISGNLGVSCTYCHTQFEWEKNDKLAKGTTQKMFRMIGFINKTYFPGENRVSCWTCHHANPSQVAYPKDAPHQAEEIMHISAEDKNKPAEQVFHNIQSLKGVPAGRMPQIMDFFANSLGVRCGHCHVPDQWEKDDKDTKKKAREMLSMVHGIIKEFYGGQGPIGCWGCHEGKIKPELEPRKPAQPTP